MKPLRDGLLVHPERCATTSWPRRARPRGHRPLLDPPGLLPHDAEEVGTPLNGTRAEQVDGEPLEQGRELAAWLRSGDLDLLHPVGGTLDARDLPFDPGC